MAPFHFEQGVPDAASLPLPSGAGEALPISGGGFNLGVSPTVTADLPNPFLTAADAAVAEPTRLGLTEKQWDWIGRLAAGIEDATLAVQGKQGTAMSDLLKRRRADVGEERAARTEERRTKTEEARLGLERGRFEIAQATEQRAATKAIFDDATVYLQGAEGLSPAAREVRENGLIARMAAKSPGDINTLRLMFNDRTFSEDMSVLVPHINPR